MIQKAVERESATFWRLKNMELMRWCLIAYQNTKYEEYYEWAIIFGNWSKLYKKDLEKLLTGI